MWVALEDICSLTSLVNHCDGMVILGEELGPKAGGDEWYGIFVDDAITKVSTPVKVHPSLCLI